MADARPGAATGTPARSKLLAPSGRGSRSQGSCVKRIKQGEVREEEQEKELCEEE